MYLECVYEVVLSEYVPLLQPLLVAPLGSDECVEPHHVLLQGADAVLHLPALLLLTLQQLCTAHAHAHTHTHTHTHTHRAFKRTFVHVNVLYMYNVYVR